MVILIKLVLGDSIGGLFVQAEIKERRRWLMAAGTFECGVTGIGERASERTKSDMWAQRTTQVGAGGDDQVTMVTVACAWI
jgi:hypothetical protein